jgi:GNAT superfamily N-acetyltransferase
MDNSRVVYRKTTDTHVVEATTPEAYEAARQLMIEYMDMVLGEDCATAGGGIEAELANYPASYMPPHHLLFVSYQAQLPCGVIALKPISAESAEIKRLYVRPSARGHGVAEALMRRLMDVAKQGGHHTLYLDSLHRFAPAQRLYEKLGFTYCEPYDPNTTEAMRDAMVFMRCELV